jgi:hypothetical protein
MFDALAEQVAAALDLDDAVIDGEIVAVDETGRPQFYDLLRGSRRPMYVTFGADLRSMSLSERRRRLQAICGEIVLPDLRAGRGGCRGPLGERAGRTATPPFASQTPAAEQVAGDGQHVEAIDIAGRLAPCERDHQSRESGGAPHRSCAVPRRQWRG